MNRSSTYLTIATVALWYVGYFNVPDSVSLWALLPLTVGGVILGFLAGCALYRRLVTGRWAR